MNELFPRKNNKNLLNANQNSQSKFSFLIKYVNFSLISEKEPKKWKCS